MAISAKNSQKQLKRLGATVVRWTGNALWFLGRNAFLCIIFLVLIDLLLGELLFYQYVSVPKAQQPDPAPVTGQFHEQAYQSVLNQWVARKAALDASSQTTVADPFH